MLSQGPGLGSSELKPRRPGWPIAWKIGTAEQSPLRGQIDDARSPRPATASQSPGQGFGQVIHRIQVDLDRGIKIKRLLRTPGATGIVDQDVQLVETARQRLQRLAIL